MATYYLLIERTDMFTCEERYFISKITIYNLPLYPRAKMRYQDLALHAK